MKKKVQTGAGLAFTVLAAGYCLMHPDTVRESAAVGVGRCLTVLIPSLYAMLIVSALLTGSGVLGLMPKISTAIGRAVFGMEGTVLPIFTFGMFAGYPVGTRLLFAEYSAGRLSRTRAAVLSGLCFGAGPAFIFGCVSAQLYGSPAEGVPILISNAAANVILALLLSPFLRRGAGECPRRRELRFDAGLLTESVSSAGRAMAQLCFTVTTFAVLTGALVQSGAVPALARVLSRITGRSAETSAALISAFLDVTAVSELPRGDTTLLPAVSALVSFGGVCVFFQLTAITGGKLPLLPVITVRAAAAVLSYIICSLIAPVRIVGEAVAVFASSAPTVRIFRADSAVPSVLLIIMTAAVTVSRGDLLQKDE